MLSASALLALNGCGSTGEPSDSGFGDTTPPTVTPPPGDENTPPVANAGGDQNASQGTVVLLDGSASSDADGDTLTYSWTLTAPSGSSATLSDSTVVNPTFTADAEGSYAVELIVNDGTEDSPVDSMTVISEFIAMYPNAPDSYEGAAGDNDPTTAGTIEVGALLQARSIYPLGDFDWVKVELEEGKLYEIFTTNLNEVGDTTIFLYDDVDQSLGNHIDDDDDHIDYDSDIEEFNATRTGTYYLKVRSYSAEELTSYQLGIREHVDADDDGYTPTFDCNDNDDSIYPFATEIPGDGIDQDCSGVDAIADGTPDNYETDNDIASAKPIAETEGSYWEIQHRKDIFSQMRSLHDTSDTDFFSITIPAYSAAYVIEDASGLSGGLSDYDWYAYDENGTEVDNGTPSIDETVINDTDTEKTYHMEIRSNGSDTGWYVPALTHIGEDRDGDGYYTHDWDNDCDDTNASINYGETDPFGDGIDQNCDGVDGDNNDYDAD